MNEEIIKYAKSNGWDLRHDVDALAFAAEKTANLFSDIEPMKVIRFMLGNEPIGGFTHSYGFHTRVGREIIKLFQSNYYEQT